MNRYDPDLIAALAAGSLDPTEAAALEAQIAADPRASAELAAHRIALDAIHRSPTPLLSAAERTELRRAVAAALHLEAAAAPAAAPERRRVAWRPLAVAAALAALVVAVPLFGLLSVGDDQATMTTMALATTSPGDATSATMEAAGGTPPNLAAEGSTADDATLSAAPPDVDPATARFLGEADKALQDLLADPAPLFAASPGALAACGAQARVLLESAEPSAVLLPLNGGEVVIWFLSDDGVSVHRLATFDPATCQLLAVYP